MHIKNFTLLVLCILLATARLQAQDDNDNSGSSDESKEERVSGLLKELFEFRIAKDALRIYNLTNVDKSWTPNGELRDSIIGFRELASINFMLRDTMAYDHFWSFISNGGGYKTPDGASEGSAEARFKIQFNPDWNKTQEDPPEGTERKYSVEIHPSVPNNDDINETDFKEATNKPITDTKLSFADNQNNENNREAVNSGIYEAMEFIAGKIDSLGSGEAIGEGIVKFSEGRKATTYGFDSLRYDAHKGTGLYERVTIAGKSYMTPWFSVKTGGSVTIKAAIQPLDTLFHVDSVEFRSSAGIPVTSQTTESDSIKMLTIQGQNNEQVQTIEAYVSYTDSSGKEQEQILGQCKVITYDNTANELVVVPLNEATAPDAFELQQKLNKVYKASLASWNVTVEEALEINQDKWDVKEEDGELGYKATGRKYSKEMRNIYQYYKDEREVEDNKYYLFLTDFPVKNTLTSYMPFKGQFAFVSTREVSSDDLPRLAAHELAHGTFRLYHTFSDRNEYPVPQGTTDNLMDYNDGKELHKYQWDYIHDPQGVWFAGLIKEEEAATVTYGIIEEINGDTANATPVNISSHTFFTPASFPITFSKVDNILVTDFDFKSNTEEDIKVPEGALFKFKKDGTRYRAHYVYDKSAQRWIFKGYLSDETGKYYKESLTKEKQIPYTANIHKGTLTQKETMWDITDERLPYNFPVLNYKGSGYVAKSLILEPCGYLKNKYYNQYKDSHILKTAIDKDPCNLLHSIPWGEGLGYETEFMKGLKNMVNAGLYIAFFPAAIEITAPMLIELGNIIGQEAATIITELSKEKVKEFAIGFSIDASLQAGIMYYFEGIPKDQILENLDYKQMALTGVENTLDGKWDRIAGDAITPLYDAFTENGNFDENLTLDKFINDYTTGLLINIVLNADNLKHSFDKLKAIFRNSPAGFIKGLDKIGLTNLQRAKVIRRFRSLTGKSSLKLKKIDHVVNCNSFDIASETLHDASGNRLKPKSFWNKSSDQINHFVSDKGKYYIKHDPETGEILFYDVENEDFLGYYLDSDQSFKSYSTKKEFEENMLPKLKKIHGIDNTNSISVNGVNIPLQEGKINVILGKYMPSDEYDYVPLKDVFEELKMPKYYEKTVNLDPAKRRIHLLNVPDGTWENSDFWNDINKPLIDDIKNNPNKYNVIILPNPNKAERLRGNFKMEKDALDVKFDFIEKDGYFTIEKE